MKSSPSSKLQSRQFQGQGDKSPFGGNMGTPRESLSSFFYSPNPQLRNSAAKIRQKEDFFHFDQILDKIEQENDNSSFKENKESQEQRKEENRQSRASLGQIEAIEDQIPRKEAQNQKGKRGIGEEKKILDVGLGTRGTGNSNFSDYLKIPKGNREVSYRMEMIKEGETEKEEKKEMEEMKKGDRIIQEIKETKEEEDHHDSFKIVLQKVGSIEESKEHERGKNKEMEEEIRPKRINFERKIEHKKSKSNQGVQMDLEKPETEEKLGFARREHRSHSNYDMVKEEKNNETATKPPLHKSKKGNERRKSQEASKIDEKEKKKKRHHSKEESRHSKQSSEEKRHSKDSIEGVGDSKDSRKERRHSKDSSKERHDLKGKTDEEASDEAKFVSNFLDKIEKEKSILDNISQNERDSDHFWEKTPENGNQSKEERKNEVHLAMSFDQEEEHKEMIPENQEVPLKASDQETKKEKMEFLNQLEETPFQKEKTPENFNENQNEENQDQIEARNEEEQEEFIFCDESELADDFKNPIVAPYAIQGSKINRFFDYHQ